MVEPRQRPLAWRVAARSMDVPNRRRRGEGGIWANTVNHKLDLGGQQMWDDDLH